MPQKIGNLSNLLLQIPSDQSNACQWQILGKNEWCVRNNNLINNSTIVDHIIAVVDNNDEQIFHQLFTPYRYMNFVNSPPAKKERI